MENLFENNCAHQKEIGVQPHAHTRKYKQATHIEACEWLIFENWFGFLWRIECNVGNICLSNFQFAKIHFSIYFHVKDSKMLCIRFHFNWHDAVWLAKSKSFLLQSIYVDTSCSQSFLHFTLCARVLKLYSWDLIRTRLIEKSQLNVTFAANELVK